VFAGEHARGASTPIGPNHASVSVIPDVAGITEKFSPSARSVGMISRMLTEQEELTAYEAKLARSERLIAEATARRDEEIATIERETPNAEYLRLIVKGMRGLLGVTPDRDLLPDVAATEDRSLREVSRRPFGANRAPVSGGSKMTYGGLPSIPSVILAVLGPHDASLDEIFQAICAHSAYEGRKKPSRGSVNNRLNEMAERGEIVKVRKGIYKNLPHSEGAQNPDESGGGPNPAQLDVEQSPDEQVMSAHRGHRYGGGSAEAASGF
jgi:hypothetical protein